MLVERQVEIEHKKNKEKHFGGLEKQMPGKYRYTVNSFWGGHAQDQLRLSALDVHIGGRWSKWLMYRRD